MDLGDPTEAALLCAEAFDRAGVRYAVFGGLALAAYGEPRETRDVDLAVLDVPAARARDIATNCVACPVGGHEVSRAVGDRAPQVYVGIPVVPTNTKLRAIPW